MGGFLRRIAAKIAAQKIGMAMIAALIVAVYEMYDLAKSSEKFSWYLAVAICVGIIIWKFGRKDFIIIIGAIRGKKEQVSKVVLGQSIVSIIDVMFDYGLYVPVVDAFSAEGPIGILKAFGLLTCGSAIASLIEIAIYDRLGDDWLGWEAAKVANDFGQEFLRKLRPETLTGKIVIPIARMIIRIFFWAIKKNTLTAHIAMSVYLDPFQTTVYLRKGTRYAGLSKRDWGIFFSSLFISNAWWTIRTFGLIWIAKGLFALAWGVAL